MSNDYATAWDALGAAIGSGVGKSSGSVNNIDHLTIDQQLKVAEVAALLAIAQEISAFNPQNTTVMVDGEKKNGWGFPAV